MATVVKCVMVLHASTFPGFSSAKLSSSSSSFSSIPAQRRLPGFKGPKFRPPSTFGSVIRAERAKDDDPTTKDFRTVYAKRNKLQSQLARNKKEIERLREVIESAWKDLGRVVQSLKKIDQDLSAKPEPEPENHAVNEEAELESPAKRTKRTRENFYKNYS
ncbi:hypothetical protein Patl1_12198 [Pistacia atlantica]|uniref:Uncharacterized protein n=1 Tax=Pistacia atlantica TaxID=434234 RepID=A0ACC1A8B3_9ROSI|nr:hypothetical protein Patl1_12198 [Pistacia atlantica]